ncbi:MAG: antibiotic biosynthesis monooxygenase [Pirellulaceae bacterium]
MIAETPFPPYYAVIFTSTRTSGENGYQKMAELMVKLAGEQEGFLGVESAREEIGITVSYWRDLTSIQKWRENVQHTVARNKGRSDWYTAFKTRIALVERDYGFVKDLAAANNDESKLNPRID